jgi:hypothetical protein
MSKLWHDYFSPVPISFLIFLRDFLMAHPEVNDLRTAAHDRTTSGRESLTLKEVEKTLR